MQQLTRTRKQSQSVVAVVFKSDLSGLSSYSETDWGPGHLCSISLASDLFQTLLLILRVCFVWFVSCVVKLHFLVLMSVKWACPHVQLLSQREREREFCGIPSMLVDYELIYTGRNCRPPPPPFCLLLPRTHARTYARTHARTHTCAHTHTHTHTHISIKQASKQPTSTLQ